MKHGPLHLGRLPYIIPDHRTGKICIGQMADQITVALVGTLIAPVLIGIIDKGVSMRFPSGNDF